MQVLKNILVSEVGMNLPPEIYEQAIQHYIEHEQSQMMKTMNPSGLTGAGEAPQSATSTTEG